VKPSNVDFVRSAILSFVDESGHGTATRGQIAVRAGLSEATVKRAIQQIQATGSLIIECKKGHSGGYLFADPKRVKRVSQTGQTGQPNGSESFAMPCLYQSGQGPSDTDLTRLDATQTGQQTGQPDPIAASPAYRGPQYVHIPEMDKETRMRGAQFMREVRLSLVPRKARNGSIVESLEPLPKQPPA